MITIRQNRGRQVRSGGFTLVEILVVIAIIVILAALLTPVAMRALSTSRNARMGIELAQLDQAIEAYRLEMGDYPPSFGENYSPANRYYTAMEQHLRKCFPNMSKATKDAFYDILVNMQSSGKEISQDEALVLWLSKLSTDKTNPFRVDGPRKVFREFDARRLSDTDGDGFQAFDAGYAKGTPYVYLDSRTYRLHCSASTAATTQLGASGPRIQPYFDATGKFMRPTAFQIICAGQDGDFGAAKDITFNAAGIPTANHRVFPNSMNYTDEDMDNLTNFSDGKILKYLIPQ